DRAADAGLEAREAAEEPLLPVGSEDQRLIPSRRADDGARSAEGAGFAGVGLQRDADEGDERRDEYEAGEESQEPGSEGPWHRDGDWRLEIGDWRLEIGDWR